MDLDAIPSPEGEGPSPADVAAFGEQVAEPVGVIADNAPEQAADAAADLGEVRGRLAEGDGSAFEDPATFATLATIEQAVAAECGFTNIAVSAADFAFEGVPATVPAGEVNVLMTNTSGHDEDHVMVVSRAADGQVITPEEFSADEASPPHFVLGMITSLTVV